MAGLVHASIVINNYNYARFLGEAIESALAQTYPHTEVVVVDDGSTDDSRAVIARFGDRIQSLFKPNGGQASAFNAGLRASTGEVVCFLDADDTLLPTAVETAVEALVGTTCVKVHWPLIAVDERGVPEGELIPSHPLPEGDLREGILEEGPTGCSSAPTSGNAWTRSFLKQIFPVPEADFRLCADTYLFVLAAALGPVAALREPQGCYRLHETSNYRARSFEEQLELALQTHERLFPVLERHLRQQGVPAARQHWQRQSFYHRLREALQELYSVVPSGSTLILADDDTWGTPSTLMGRPRLPLMERGGEYWGPPADARSALREIERLKEKGARFLVFAWPSFWWLDHYAGLRATLETAFRRELANDRLIVFSLEGAR
jgi:glycosyltransferase involved in cell wall biosynthesis